VAHFLYLSIFSMLLMSGCSSTPVIEADIPASVFQQPIEQVRTAAVNALVTFGFDVTKQGSNYVEGHRPHKVGLLVGSGGETVGVWLTDLEPGVTAVRVDTAKSFVGIIGQRDWEADILREMRQSLRQ